MVLKDNAFISAISLVLLAAFALVAILARYDLQFREATVVRLDRWTGAIKACDGRQCIDLLDQPSLKSAQHSPRDLLDEIERSDERSPSWRDKVVPVEPAATEQPGQKFQQEQER